MPRRHHRPPAPQPCARCLLLGAALLAGGCRDQPAEPLGSLAPAPLPTLGGPGGDGGAGGRGALFQPAAAPVHGERPPTGARVVRLQGEQVALGEERFAPRQPAQAQALAERVRGATVLLVPEADTFLAQASEALAALGASARAVWMAHPEEKVAYPLVLRDEEAFGTWLDEVAPGRLRVVQRADGFEVATALGKLPGPDPNGPSVPVRGGRQDVGALRAGLVALRRRFPTARDVCFVPSFGTEVAQVARALSAAWAAPGEALFDEVCLVYPTPPPRDGGG